MNVYRRRRKGERELRGVEVDHQILDLLCGLQFAVASDRFDRERIVAVPADFLTKPCTLFLGVLNFGEAVGWSATVSGSSARAAALSAGVIARVMCPSLGHVCI